MLISIVLIGLNQRFHPYYILGKNEHDTNNNEDFTKERKKLETHTEAHTPISSKIILKVWGDVTILYKSVNAIALLGLPLWLNR